MINNWREEYEKMMDEFDSHPQYSNDVGLLIGGIRHKTKKFIERVLQDKDEEWLNSVLRTASEARQEALEQSKRTEGLEDSHYAFSGYVISLYDIKLRSKIKSTMLQEGKEF
jgi:hypothetical protein